MADKTLGPLTFGFDIGIASVGWCVLGENHIVDLGVRCFDKAETAKKGEPLNLARRTARLMRRRLRRRAWRLVKLARLLKHSGLIADTATVQTPSAVSPWQMRVAGLDRKLDAEEWARVIYHLCKHRGFHWISRAEKKKAEGDAKSESGRVKASLDETQRRKESYRSAAEMMVTEFRDKQRNRKDDYSKSLSRLLLSEELALLFKRQRELGSPYTDAGLEEAVLGTGDRKSGLFWAQKPPLCGKQMLERIGRCTFERSGGPDGKGEYRAPKASFTAERHVWLTKLNNLRIVVDGETRPLTEEERRVALPLPYGYADTKLTYARLRTALTKKAGLSNFDFAGIPEEKESDTLAKLPAWETLSKTLKGKGLETEWESMAGAATGGNPQMLDNIAYVLSVYKDGDEVDAELRKLKLPGGETMIEVLGEISFDKFHNLSLKALRKIVPHMEAGLRYDEAVAAVPEYGHHSQLRKAGAGKETYLPALYEHARGHKQGEEGKMILSERIDRDIVGGIPRNPVVLRALNQARKVMNALIRKHKRSPSAVHIEVARDLSRPLDERKRVKTAQEEYRERNEKDKADFAREFDMPARSREFEKFQLYREQQGKCAYSLETLDLDRVLHDAGYVEIDHALPYRRSFDDSKNNKVLVLKEENQNKGNRTPYEYLDGANNSPRWHAFAAFVESNKPYRLAKRQRLLRKDFSDKAAMELRSRNLNDTRYICKFFKNYVEEYLKFDADAKRCVVVSGTLTSALRARWGLPTSKEKREKDDRHHAMDAAVIAACGHRVVQRLSTIVNAEGWAHRPDMGGYVSMETSEILSPQEFMRKDEIYRQFPRPWKHFRDELLARLNIDGATELRAKMASFGTYPPEAIDALRPLFVSRAPQRRNGGALHKETIYGKNLDAEPAQSTAVQRVDVSQLEERHLAAIVGFGDDRNKGLLASLRLWVRIQKEETLRKLNEIEGGLGKGKNKRKPTAEEESRIAALRALPRKPTKSDPPDGPYTGNTIKRVKLTMTKTSGAYVRGGVAELGKVLYTKLYRRNGELLFMPCYALPDECLYGLPPLPDGAEDTGIQLYDNDVVRISHPNLSQCYKEIRRHKNADGETLIDVEAAFPDGNFLGYWAYFEPSNNRPVVQLHDSAQFFLLEPGKMAQSKALTLVAKEKRSKRDSSGVKEFSYQEYAPPLERKPLCFSLEENIKRQIGTANVFEKLHVDLLGNLYPAPPETRRGLA